MPYSVYIHVAQGTPDGFIFLSRVFTAFDGSGHRIPGTAICAAGAAHLAADVHSRHHADERTVKQHIPSLQTFTAMGLRNGLLLLLHVCACMADTLGCVDMLA